LLVINNAVLNTESSGGRDEKLTSYGGMEQGRKRWIIPGSFSLKRQGCTVNTRICELTRLFPNIPRALKNEHGEIHLFREETLGP
jgi:hypothetical protein